jgi:predicted phosphodiesterase
VLPKRSVEVSKNYFNKRLTTFLTIFQVLFFYTTVQSRDITFVFNADLHYGSGAIGFINVLNNLQGREYPQSVGGTVDKPRAVISAGDLTNGGTQREWDAFVADHGLNGEGPLDFLIYEGYGNHDHFSNNTIVWTDIEKRNKTRQGISNISDNGYHYSWDWDDIHFIQLNLMVGNKIASNTRFHPNNSLDFLIKDLAENVGTSDKQVVLFHHCNPTIDDTRWDPKDKEAYAKAIKDYNIIAMFIGHTHSWRRYTWSGIDVFNTADVYQSTNGSYLVIHITDTKMWVLNASGTSWDDIEQKDVDPPVTNITYKPVQVKNSNVKCYYNRKQLRIDVDYSDVYQVSIFTSDGKSAGGPFTEKHSVSYAWEPKTSGIYVVRIKTETKSLSRKLVISK